MGVGISKLKMTLDEIVDKFELQVDDASELSTDESYDLANDVYTDVQDDRPWEWLKASFSGTTSTTVPYIALPADFKMIAPNKCDESIVFVGASFSEYKVISFADRRDWRDVDGYCYIDIPNMRLVFTLQPTSAKALEYDYIKIAPALAAGTDQPLFRAGFHKIISFGMAMKFPSIEQADKSTSYASDNKLEYKNILSDMAVEDANIKLAHS